MFDLVDAAIVQLLSNDARSPDGSGNPLYAVVFDRPDQTFAASSASSNSLPTIDFFLFAVQENRDLRNTEPLRQRQSDGSVQLSPGPVRIDCHYLVTAFCTHMADEHKLLGRVMTVLFTYPEIPAATIDAVNAATPGAVKLSGPIRAWTAIAPTRETGIDLWRALGGEARACFHYRVTINAFAASQSEEIVPVTAVVFSAPDPTP